MRQELAGQQGPRGQASVPVPSLPHTVTPPWATLGAGWLSSSFRGSRSAQATALLPVSCRHSGTREAPGGKELQAHSADSHRQVPPTLTLYAEPQAGRGRARDHTHHFLTQNKKADARFPEMSGWTEIRQQARAQPRPESAVHRGLPSPPVPPPPTPPGPGPGPESAGAVHRQPLNSLPSVNPHHQQQRCPHSVGTCSRLINSIDRPLFSKTCSPNSSSLN